MLAAERPGQWHNVYSLATDEYIQGMERGHKILAELQRHKLAPCGAPEYIFCESNGRNGILVDKRINGWDGIDICLTDMGLTPGNYCLIEVSGRFASDNRKLPPKGEIGLVFLPSYYKLANHALSDGEEFTLTCIVPILTDTGIYDARISTNDKAKNASFTIDDINVSVKPLPDKLQKS